MIKVVNNVNILIITHNKWRTWQANSEATVLQRVESILCSHVIHKIWIEKCIHYEVTSNLEVMKCVFAHLDANSFDTLDYI